MCVSPSPRVRAPGARRPSAWPIGSARRWIAAYVETPGAAAPAARGSRSRHRRRCAWPSSSVPRRSRLRGTDDERGDPGLRARPQRDADRRRQAATPVWSANRSSARSSTRSCGAAATSTCYVISAEREHRGVRAGRAFAGAAIPTGLGAPTRGPAPSRRWPRARRGSPLPFFELANLVMVYLLGIVLVAMRHRARPVAPRRRSSAWPRFDFFFVPPRLHLRGHRRSLPVHVRGHARRRARDQQPHRAHRARRPTRRAIASSARPRSTR